MAGSKRDIYEAGRADERAEVVAWLRSTAGAQIAATLELPESVTRLVVDAGAAMLATAAARIETGEHAEVEVVGDVGRD